MEQITSTANEKVRLAVQLRQKSSARNSTGLFVIEGARLAADAPEDALDTVFVTEQFLEKAPEHLLDRLGRLETVCVSEHVLEKMSDTKTPQGIIAFARMPVYTREQLMKASAPDAAPHRTLLLLLEDIQDPGNLGTMFRTAEAAGATGIIMSRGTVDVFHPKTVRATMSSIFRVPFMTVDSIADEVRMLQKSQVMTYAAYLGAERFYDEPDYRTDTAFLIGNEAHGLDSRTAQAAGEKILIPMEGSIESLNAAMSAGILLYEAHRQRRRNT